MCAVVYFPQPMKKKIIFSLLIVILTKISFGQNIDSLKLTEAEIPAGYTISNKLAFATTYASLFYEQTDLYESFLGKIKRKETQSFDKKGDRGSIIYIELENEFKRQGFLDGLLWGKNTKPTKSTPDEYYAKGTILVIWSFGLKSELKQISKTKVLQMLR